MTRRAAVALALIATLVAGCATASPSLRRPNVVLIVVDDLGATDLGSFGSGYYETPHLDRLAREGVRFTQAYAACAVCSPSRAALMTGRAPARIGVTDWIHHAGPEAKEAMDAGRNLPGFDRPRGRPLLTPRNHAWLEPDEVTLAELLAARGYATGYVGKWHLGPAGHHPEQQGFSFNAGGCRFGAPPSYFDPYENEREGRLPTLAPRRAGEYLTDREADEAVRFIDAHRDDPFLLVLAHYAVHSPIQAKPDDIERFRAKPATNHRVPAYAAMIASVDDAAGRVMVALERQGLDGNTLVIFTSDNGGAVHFPATDNAPLRKGKGYAYEGGLRVPMIARWPDRIPGGGDVATPVSGIDVVPTVAAATGTALPADRVIDGVDLLPVLTTGAALPERPLTWHFPHYWWGTRITPYSVLRDGDWKLIHRYENGADELYDLAHDPGETTDRALEQPERTAAMRARLRSLLEEQGARFPVPNPDHEPGR